MRQPQTTATAATKHWPSKEPNALGQAQPICKNSGSYYARPVMAKRPEDVTCGICAKRAVRVI